MPGSRNCNTIYYQLFTDIDSTFPSPLQSFAKLSGQFGVGK